MARRYTMEPRKAPAPAPAPAPLTVQSLQGAEAFVAPADVPSSEAVLTMPASYWERLYAHTDWEGLAGAISAVSYSAAAINALRAEPQYTRKVYLPSDVIIAAFGQGYHLSRTQPKGDHGFPVPPAAYGGDIIALGLDLNAPVEPP